MKRIFKKTVAFTAAFAMTLSVSAVAGAEAPTSGTLDTESQLEGYVDKNVYDITVPTVGEDGLDFTVDPQGLLKVADDEKYTIGEGAVYFANAGAPEEVYTEVAGAPTDEEKHYVKKGSAYELYDADTDYSAGGYDDYVADETNALTKYYTKSEETPYTYSGTSDAIELYNNSSFDINVSLDIAVTAADAGITLVEEAALTSATEPSLYLGLIVDSKEPVAVTAEEFAPQATTLPAVPEKTESVDGYEIVAKTTSDDPEAIESPNGYYYTYELSSSYDKATSKKVTYKLEGACDTTADWSSVPTNVLKADIVWTVTADELTPPEPDPAAPSIAATTGTYSKASGATFDVDLGVGNLAAEGIAKLEISADNSAFSSYGGNYTFENDTLTLASGYMGGAAVGSTRYVKVTFDDDAATAVVLTLTVAN